MKKTKTSLLIVTLVAGALSSCGGGKRGSDDNSTVTKIVVQNYRGGVGRKWLDNGINKFQQLAKNKSYEDGKTGVEISVVENIPIDESALDKKSFNICFGEAGTPVQNLYSSKQTIAISDVIRGKALKDNGSGELVEENVTIESKIKPDYRIALLDYDETEYVALPHDEWYPGLSYDIEAFNNHNAYFADSSATNKVPFRSKYSPGYDFCFVDDYDDEVNCKKTCGCDGIYGTEDDGLPSSLQELLVLSDYLASEGVVPFTVAGNHKDYTHYLLEGLLASLGGKESAETFYKFNGKQKIVKRGDAGYSSTKLWGTNTPDVVLENDAGTQITPENGYKIRETADRYYAIAFLKEVATNTNFLDEDSKSSGSTNVISQTNFIMSNKKATAEKQSFEYGMIFEGSYWVNEARDANLFEDYKIKTGITSERQIGWLPLPVQVNGQVTEGNGRSSSLMDTAYSFCYICNNREAKKRPGLVEACKDFLRFLYSDDQLNEYTQITGGFKAGLDYTPDVTKLTTIQKQILAQKQRAGVVYAASNQKVFRNNRAALMLHNEAMLWRPYPSQTHDMFIPLKTYTARDCFEKTFFTDQEWSSMLAK